MKKTIDCACKECGKYFEGIPSEVARGRSLFCSLQCYTVWRAKQRVIICKQCGTVFIRNNSLAQFCSPDCWNTHVRNNRSNTGKKYKSKDGYIGVRTKDNKIVQEHRAVVEVSLNRPLTKGELVHHMNGIRDDNRPENLCVVNTHNHEHGTLVKRLQARILELEKGGLS